VKPAILPDVLLAREPRKLASLGNGEIGHINFTQMLVLPDRTCYLDPDGPLSEDGPRFDRVRVRKDDIGAFHVTVPASAVYTYTPGLIRTTVPATFVPVASLNVD
jgi:hypothetical protein